MSAGYTIQDSLTTTAATLKPAIYLLSLYPFIPLSLYPCIPLSRINIFLAFDQYIEGFDLA